MWLWTQHPCTHLIRNAEDDWPLDYNLGFVEGPEPQPGGCPNQTPCSEKYCKDNGSVERCLEKLHLNDNSYIEISSAMF